MRVLIVAPHPDDEAIGCGGGICLHTERGDRVVVVFLTSGELGLKHLSRGEAWRIRENEAEAAAEVLGIAGINFLRLPDWGVSKEVDGAAALLGRILNDERPNTVYLPHPEDWHPDHQPALSIVQTALAGSGEATPALLTYEVWSPLATYDRVEDITKVIGRKMQAVRCYGSQLTHFQYDRAVLGLNQYRGSLAARCGYAEVYRSVGPPFEQTERAT